MRVSSAAGLVCLLVAACGGSGAGPTPREAWETWRAAQVEERWGDLYEALAPDRRAEAEKAWREEPTRGELLPEVVKDLGVSEEAAEALTLKEIFVALNEKEVARTKERDPEGYRRQLEELRAAEYLGGEADEERAEVRFRVAGRQHTLPLVLRDGQWYLDRGPL